MVHVKKCPYGKRSTPTTEFYKDGKPQIYCMGWIDSMTDEYIPECKKCADLAGGLKCQQDSDEEYRKTLLQ